jgi:hypothetical protein
MLDMMDLDSEDLACLGLRRADRPLHFGFDYDGYIADLKAAEQSPAAAPPQRARRTSNRDASAPDGLRTPAEAASKLGCSIKTLNGHIASGALGYVIIGHGKKRPRKMFTDGDLNAFITNQTRKDVPCPSTASRARRSSTSNSESTVIAFTAAPKPRPGAKPKK